MTLSKVQRLIDKMQSGKPVLGMLNMSYSPELVEILGYVGFDFIFNLRRRSCLRKSVTR